MATDKRDSDVRRSFAAPVAVVLLSAITGGWLLQQGADRAENVYVQVRELQEVVDRVQSSFVEEVDEQSLYHSAIDGVIEDLGDPHTSLIPAADYENFRIRTEGEYGGVGLEVSDRNGFVTVISPISGGPGERVGIRAGDQFFEIEGVRADTMSTDQAVDLLRGRPDTEVHVKMLRPGVRDPIAFTLKREVVRLRAVPFALMLRNDIGYVPLLTVRETSSKEIGAAVDSLKSEGLKGLILDLRGNPGGLLDEGIAVSDLFLDKGDAIVETRGRTSDQNATYRASTGDHYPGLPVVVLVDASSASASEIISGALQDHDRAVLVGETTYGKGSVQTLFRLTGGDVLRLTTARWYTPLGRSINLDPKDRPVDSAQALALSGQTVQPMHVSGRPEYTTDGGRTVYGGGGITPDLFVAPETLSPTAVEGVRGLFPQFGRFTVAMFNFAVEYVQRHPDLKPGFTLSDADLDAFFQSLPEDAAVSRDDFQAADRFVRYHLEREIALQAWGDSGQFVQTEKYDRQLQKALDLLSAANSPDQLLEAVRTAEPDDTF